MKFPLLAAISILLLAQFGPCGHEVKEKDLLHQAISDGRPSLALKTLPNTEIAISGSTAKSKFDAIKQLFEKAKAPSLEYFRIDSLLMGKCSFRMEPHNFYSDNFNIYVEKDPVLGNIVYGLPNLLDIPPPSRRDIASADVPQSEAPTLHRQRREEMNFFSSVQEVLPKDLPLLHLAEPRLRDALYIFYAKPSKKQGPDGIFVPLHQVNFRLRVGASEITQKPILYVEHYCADPLGCLKAGSEDTFSYLEPMAYCYYLPRYEFTVRPK